MSATNAPFGMRPAFHPSGLDRAEALADGIENQLNVNILKGQPVGYTSNGTIEPYISGGEAPTPFVGAFAGVEWTDVTGRRRVSNYWPANTEYVTGSCIAYFYNDPKIVYEIQTAGTVTQAEIGQEYDITNSTAGSTTTGLSAATLGIVPVLAPSSGQMRILNIAPYPDNAWGDPFVIVRAVITNSQIEAPTLPF